MTFSLGFGKIREKEKDGTKEKERYKKREKENRRIFETHKAFQIRPNLNIFKNSKQRERERCGGKMGRFGSGKNFEIRPGFGN